MCKHRIFFKSDGLENSVLQIMPYKEYKRQSYHMRENITSISLEILALSFHCSLLKNLSHVDTDPFHAISSDTAMSPYNLPSIWCTHSKPSQ